jgi:hypothetical protein
LAQVNTANNIWPTIHHTGFTSQKRTDHQQQKNIAPAAKSFQQQLSFASSKK